MNELLYYLDKNVGDYIVVACIILIVFLLTYGIYLRFLGRIVFFGGSKDIFVIITFVIIPLFIFFLFSGPTQGEQSNVLPILFIVSIVGLMYSMYLTYKENRVYGFSRLIAIYACFYKILCIIVIFVIIFRFLPEPKKNKKRTR